tara:strand:- start:953 stop:1225 length:273 start_codon:yes stop_codon:yes gene_type:complete
LVVLGILIPLSINNWNQQRKRQNNSTRLLTVLQEDLSVNINRLKKVIYQENRPINQATTIVKFQEVYDSWEDLSKQLKKYMNELFQRPNK